jgi:hypothetical protein
VYGNLSPIAELSQVGPVRVLEPPSTNVNIKSRIMLWWCTTTCTHDLVVSSGDTDCMAGGPKAVLELRFCALVAGAIEFGRDPSLSI